MYDFPKVLYNFFPTFLCDFQCGISAKDRETHRNLKIHESWSARKYQFGNMLVLFFTANPIFETTKFYELSFGKNEF